MICMICTCFAGWDLYDLDLMHNFSISAKKDLDYLDHDLSEVCNVGVFCSCALLLSLFENGTACHNSGFPVHGQEWGTLSSNFGRAA